MIRPLEQGSVCVGLIPSLGVYKMGVVCECFYGLGVGWGVIMGEMGEWRVWQFWSEIKQ